MAERFDDEWLRVSAAAFDASLVAPSESATIGLTILGGASGDVVTQWRIADNTLSAGLQEGESDLALTIPAKDAALVVDGELEPSVAYMQGRLKASGDMALLLRLLRASESPAFKSWREGIA